MDLTMSNRIAEIFGDELESCTEAEAAQRSTRLFVRSQDQLAVYRPPATGRILTAWEAFKAFGIELLENAVCDGPAVLIPDIEEPSASLRARRLDLGLDVDDVAKAAGLEPQVVSSAEKSESRLPIRDLERICMALGLDERLIAFRAGAGGDKELAFRLRSLSAMKTHLSPQTVLSFGEAAWVIAAQQRLQDWLGVDEGWRQFTPSPNYGEFTKSPAWEYGYYLAGETRRALRLSQDEPIRSLRSLCEIDLGIPIVQIEMPVRIAGATLGNIKSRGIAVNIAGFNTNTWVRRATIAHELGHLLWDPDPKLNSLAVDEYESFDGAWAQLDRVEQRANAFAAEFLAPRVSALSVFDNAGGGAPGLRQVMETFGVSFSLARNQIWNASDRKIRLDSLRVSKVEPTPEWVAAESYTIDYFPIRDVPLSRRGDFAGAVICAAEENLISFDTASRYLVCSVDEIRENAGYIRKFFPSWWETEMESP